MSESQPLKIAIIGGGLAGAVLANALQKHKHISIDIFESAPEFSERGAAVGIATNGQIALAEIGGAVADVIERAGGVTMTSTRLVLVCMMNIMYVAVD
jgi:salicylate hydroxylase